MSAFDDAWAAFEADVGPELADAVSAHAPVVTGTLAGSIDAHDDAGTLVVGSADPDGPIAAYVTRGTVPHPIDPVNARFLHFFAADGTEVFATHVDHPGTAPNPFHIDAWDEVRDDVVAKFRDRVGADYSLAMLNPWRNRTILI